MSRRIRQDLWSVNVSLHLSRVPLHRSPLILGRRNSGAVVCAKEKVKRRPTVCSLEGIKLREAPYQQTCADTHLAVSFITNGARARRNNLPAAVLQHPAGQARPYVSICPFRVHRLEQVPKRHATQQPDARQDKAHRAICVGVPAQICSDRIHVVRPIGYASYVVGGRHLPFSPYLLDARLNSSALIPPCTQEKGP